MSPRFRLALQDEPTAAEESHTRLYADVFRRRFDKAEEAVAWRSSPRACLACCETPPVSMVQSHFHLTNWRFSLQTSHYSEVTRTRRNLPPGVLAGNSSRAVTVESVSAITMAGIHETRSVLASTSSITWGRFVTVMERCPS